MKKIFSFILLATFTLSVNAQRYMYVTQKDGTVTEYTLSSIDSIHFAVKPFENGHEYVDLGLPSGTLWATCNVGASTPFEHGNHFAWGEVTLKEVYNENTYQWFKMDTIPAYEYVDDLGLTIQVPEKVTRYITKYNTNSDYGKDGFTDSKTVLDSIDDAAAVNWGGKWRIPTYDQIEELINKCTWEWHSGTTANNEYVTGYKVTGPNGKYIFLPAAGVHSDLDLVEVGSYCYYLSSSLNESSSYCTWGIGFYSDRYYMSSSGNRYSGQSIRPVCSPQ